MGRSSESSFDECSELTEGAGVADVTASPSEGGNLADGQGVTRDPERAKWILDKQRCADGAQALV